MYQTQMKRILKWLGVAFGILILGFASLAAFALYRVYYGKHVYETVAPALPADLPAPAILVFSKTNGFREDSAVRAANAALAAMARRRGWSAVFTENGAVFHPEMLRRFQATVWNNTSGDTLNEEQKQAFQAYMEKGGGFVGIHGAGGDPHYTWRWYADQLIGAEFIGHPLRPQFQRATIHVEDRGDPATRGLPETWTRVDEWYSFKKSPRANGVKVLATLDEETYSPKMIWKEIRMGSDHPVIWKHCIGQGRAIYSALGHSASTYQEPLHLAELEGAIAWAAGIEGEGCAK